MNLQKLHTFIPRGARSQLDRPYVPGPLLGYIRSLRAACTCVSILTCACRQLCPFVALKNFIAFNKATINEFIRRHMQVVNCGLSLIPNPPSHNYPHIY
jgi:hypothetical protein